MKKLCCMVITGVTLSAAVGSVRDIGTTDDIGQNRIEATSAGISLDARANDEATADMAEFDARPNPEAEVGILRFRSDKPLGFCIIAR